MMRKRGPETITIKPLCNLRWQCLKDTKTKVSAKDDNAKTIQPRVQRVYSALFHPFDLMTFDMLSELLCQPRL